MPTTPQNAAGCRIEPPVSEPRPASASPAATAAVEPPEEPPGTQLRFQGFRVVWNPEFSVEEPIANSSRFVLPTKTAPAARRRATTVASYGGTKLERIRDAHVVFTPAVTR